MSPETLMFGRMTHNSKRVNLGRAPVHILMTRALEEMKKFRKVDEMVIQLEFGTSRLQDATTFDKLQLVEQEFASIPLADYSDESPFPGITVGRVMEVMDSPEYQAYEMICKPDKRIGVADEQINLIRAAYESKFPDCAEHFPKWIDS